jgi:hypothetical protein
MHLEARQQIRNGRSHGSRIWAAIEELWRGGYRYHSSCMGWLSFGRDVVGL